MFCAHSASKFKSHHALRLKLPSQPGSATGPNRFPTMALVRNSPLAIGAVQRLQLSALQPASRMFARSFGRTAAPAIFSIRGGNGFFSSLPSKRPWHLSQPLGAARSVSVTPEEAEITDPEYAAKDPVSESVLDLDEQEDNEFGVNEKQAQSNEGRRVPK